MQLPVDIGKVMQEANSVSEARTTPVSVSLYIDDTAPGDIIGHVRNAFASASAHTRVTISYVDGRPIVPNDQDDAAIIIAGVSDQIGKTAHMLREADTPVMVVTSLPETVKALAEASGYAIPEGDVVGPDPRVVAKELEGADEVELPEPEKPIVSSVIAESIEPSTDAEKTALRLASMINTVRGAARSVSGAVTKAANERAAQRAAEEAAAEAEAIRNIYAACAEGEPIKLTDAMRASIDKQMGEWIISACRDKKLAFALSFPFVRRPLAQDAIIATSLQNAGIGAVPLIPGTDFPIMMLNQIKMLLQIAAAYGQPLDADRVKEIVAYVFAGYSCRRFARNLTTKLPVVNVVVKGGVGFAGTYAMGIATVEYFEGGGDIIGLATLVTSVRDKAASLASEFIATPLGAKAFAGTKKGLGVAAKAGFKGVKTVGATVRNVSAN